MTDGADPGPPPATWPRSVLRGFVLGSAVALLLALLMTGIDYYRNPGAVFRDHTGLKQGAVVETWLSWFLPTAALGAPVGAAIGAFISWLKRARAT